MDIQISILSRRDRVKLFCKIYWRTLILVTLPFVLLPVQFIGNNNAYKCFYVFLLTAGYLIFDVLPVCVISLVPLAVSTWMSILDIYFMKKLSVRNCFLDTLGVMMLIVAIEKSQIHKRMALKVMLTFGCSHYRLSFILFFSSMLLSMWISNTVACGLMMPIVKAVLFELEELGVIEVYQTVGKVKQLSERHEMEAPRPSDFTVFYFLGIAYSVSIGGMATISGSETNQIFKIYCEAMFPTGNKIEFPDFFLLSLPAVLLMQSLLYMWMNFYFLGMFRVQSDVALQIGMTEEEIQYIGTLLATQYLKLGKIKIYEIIVSVAVLVTILLQATTSIASLDDLTTSDIFSFSLVRVCGPSLISAVLLFMTPMDLKFIQFFKRNNGGSSGMFEALEDSKMTDELERFLLLFRDWPAVAMVLIIIVLCKVLTEFAPSACVVDCLLPHIARVSVQSNVHPYYLMMSATLASSLPFHLATGCPANALVSAYAHIPPWKMLSAGIGPTVIAVVVTWFTLTIWSKAIWTDINIYPKWANDIHGFKQ